MYTFISSYINRKQTFRTDSISTWKWLLAGLGSALPSRVAVTNRFPQNRIPKKNLNGAEIQAITHIANTLSIAPHVGEHNHLRRARNLSGHKNHNWQLILHAIFMNFAGNFTMGNHRFFHLYHQIDHGFWEPFNNGKSMKITIDSSYFHIFSPFIVDFPIIQFCNQALSAPCDLAESSTRRAGRCASLPPQGLAESLSRWVPWELMDWACWPGPLTAGKP